MVHYRMMLLWQLWFESMSLLTLIPSLFFSFPVMLKMPIHLHLPVENSCSQGTKGLLKSMSLRMLHFCKLGHHIWLTLDWDSCVEQMLKSVPEFVHFNITGTFEEQIPCMWNKTLLKDLIVLLIMVILMIMLNSSILKFIPD